MQRALRHSGWYRLAYLVSALVAGCAPARAPGFVGSVQHADRLEVRPGIPRGEAPPEGVVRLHGEPFQDRFFDLSEDQRRELAVILADESTFEAHADGKKCGGFHADYAVQWKSEGRPYQVLLCFGCHEALSLGDGAERLNDLSDRGYERLARVLDAAGR